MNFKLYQPVWVALSDSQAPAVASLDAKVMAGDGDHTVIDMISGDQPDALEQMANDEIHQQRAAPMDALLDSLDPMDREIVMDRRNGVPIREVAKQRSCSRSRVGQLRLRATRRMRENADRLAPQWRELATA